MGPEMPNKRLKHHGQYLPSAYDKALYFRDVDPENVRWSKEKSPTQK